MRVHCTSAVLASLLLVLARPGCAFVPNAVQSGPAHLKMSMAAETSTDDLSIPYDAAARLAYDEWCQKYGKTFDAKRYEIFKGNYETITVANVVAKKEARDSGSGPPSMLTFNEFGDCTEEEYAAAMEKPQQQSQTTSTGDVLGKALEAAQSQEQARDALEDAANALAEEEEVRHKGNETRFVVLCR